MTVTEHCRTCGGSIDLYDDGQLHHVVEVDDPEGLFELIAKEHDHAAELCGGECERFSDETGGRDLHKGPLAQSWEFRCDELAELNGLVGCGEGVPACSCDAPGGQHYAPCPWAAA